MGAVILSAATLVLVVEGALLAYVIAAPVLLLAALSATSGFCLGCRMYQHVALFRRIGIV
jgi:hypothetical protein